MLICIRQYAYLSTPVCLSAYASMFTPASLSAYASMFTPVCLSAYLFTPVCLSAYLFTPVCSSAYASLLICSNSAYLVICLLQSAYIHTLPHIPHIPLSNTVGTSADVVHLLSRGSNPLGDTHILKRYTHIARSFSCKCSVDRCSSPFFSCK